MNYLPENKQIDYEFKNEVSSDEHILTLSGTIAKNYWSTDKNIDAKMVREALDDVDTPITIRLNSGGGDAYQGIEIYNYLKNHPSHITVEITGWAASAASILAMGADEVIMNTGTTMLIHNASGGVWGNADDIINYGNMVKTLDASIVDVYAERTNQSRETIESWMKEEKTFSAKECIDNNFADGIKERAKTIENNLSDTKLDDTMLNAINEAVVKAINANEIIGKVFESDKPSDNKPKTAFQKFMKKGVNK